MTGLAQRIVATPAFAGARRATQYNENAHNGQWPGEQLEAQPGGRRGEQRGGQRPNSQAWASQAQNPDPQNIEVQIAQAQAAGAEMRQPHDGQFHNRQARTPYVRNFNHQAPNRQPPSAPYGFGQPIQRLGDERPFNQGEAYQWQPGEQQADQRLFNRLQPEAVPRQQFDFKPGVKRPDKRARRRVVRRFLYLATVIGLGWAAYDDPSRVGRWSAAASDVGGPIVRKAWALTVEGVEQLWALPVWQTTSRQTNSLLPGEQSSTPQWAPPLDAASNAEAAAPKVIADVPPVREVAPDKAADGDQVGGKARKKQPFEVRAADAGLHPKLSKVLLAKLSKSDFRNAQYAIRKALETVADDAKFVWPAPRKAGAALFTIHFVEGAAEGCRRYVVTIEKDRWLTTALPVENCIIKRIGNGSAKQAAK